MPIDSLGAIHWNVSPDIFSFWIITIRWYGLLFVLPFVLGYWLLQPIFRNEGRKRSDLETLTLYMIIATIVGARLGHCIFYDPDLYLNDPIRILFVWEGGLASHGAAIGILTGMYLFVRRNREYSFLWVADRVSLVVALAGFFIRIGNLFNSEIYGVATDLPWGFIFEQKGNTEPHHPTQLYEALCYLLVFVILTLRYRKTRAQTPPGLMLGILMTGIFSARFLIEFLKLPQKEFETDLLINMGQILSIPLIIGGVILLIRARRPQVAAPVPQ